MTKENLPKTRYCLAGIIFAVLIIFGGAFGAKASETSTVQVVSPNGGEQWVVGNTYTISWKHNLEGNYEAWIDLLKGGTYYGSIAGGDIRLSNAQNLTSYSWKVGDMKGGVGPGSDYQVRITYNDVNTGKMLTDNSDNYFSIVNPTIPSIQVISPNGGEEWQIGKNYQISWKTNNLNSVPTSNNTIAMPLCAVDLYQSGIDHYIKNLIASYSFSSYSWQIPSDLTVGKYKIGVRCNEVGGATTYADMSDDYFTIKPSAITKCTDYDYGFYKHRFNESDVNEICVDPANFDWKAKGWPEHPSGKRGDETIDGWKKRVGTITSPPVTVAPPVIVPPTPAIPDNSSCMKFYYYEGRFDYATAKEICADVDGFNWKARGWPEAPSGKRGDENVEGWKKRAGMAVLSGSGGGGSLKECLADDTLLKHPDDPKVYVIKDCKKQWIKTAEEFEKNNYNWSAIKESSSVINAYTDYLAAKSNLLKVIGDNQIYRIVEGKKIIVPSPSALNNSGLNLETAATVEKSELNAYPSITLVKTENDQKVYSVNDLGFKKHIVNPDVFNSYPDNKWSDIVTISPAEINAFPETTLIKGENDYRVYRIEGNTKRWVKTANTFKKKGFKWNEVSSVNSVELNAYTTGNPIE